MSDFAADVALLFATRALRMFAYGLLSVGLVLYLTSIGFDEAAVGLLLFGTLVGDTAVSLKLTTSADRWGRRRTLVVGAMLMLAAAAAFTSTGNFWILLAAATIGVISPSGHEVGPFLPIEQSALAQISPAENRTHLFAWYNLAGSFATATGALVGGLAATLLVHLGWSPAEGYRLLVAAYAAAGVLLAILFTRMSKAAEAPPHDAPPARFGLHKSGRVVAKLSALFALDSFASGFILQSLLAYWFHLRFGSDAARLGALFFGANLLSGFSGLIAARLSKRIGLVETMVFTHIPANLILISIPFMPSEGWAMAAMLARFCVAQMDVPARQSYTMAVVAPEERSAAAGVTGIARTIGTALAAPFGPALMASASWNAAPLLLAGVLKIVYDVLLYRQFVSVRPEETH